MSITTWPWSRGEEQDKIVLYEQFLNYKLGLSEDGISDSTVCQYLKFLFYNYAIRCMQNVLCRWTRARRRHRR
jgi:hypothetical protein